MIEIKAPSGYEHISGKPKIFLAGSIEMGAADDWQARMTAALRHLDVLVLNPRRESWDAGWEQSMDNPKFVEQVDWELNALDDADIILMYFVPGTRSPVTLLELGLHAAQNPDKLFVCCPEGFWRKGNVDVVCDRYGVQQARDLNELIQATAMTFSKGAAASSG